MSDPTPTELDARLGSAIRRITFALEPDRKPSNYAWYVEQLERAAAALESGDLKAAPLTRLQFIVSPFGTEGSIEGVFEILLELVAPLAVGSSGDPMQPRSTATTFAVEMRERPDPDVFWTDDEVADAVRSGRITIDNGRAVEPADDDEECPF
jgi:hypothetical protein